MFLTFLFYYDKLSLKNSTFIIQLDVLQISALCTLILRGDKIMTQDEYRRLSWNIYKWIRKDDPDLSLQINRELYSIAERVVVEYHIRMSIDDKTSYEEVKLSLEKVADAENTSEDGVFKIDSKLISIYLNLKF